ncbi:hypothetical protein CTAYLR_007552 [Chrysophaeum taylorii]|uniref:Lipocalin/cytosolic fatty-acid binding domain-containing protein n=1 Tax=Chrysophaeum taylorii TaxID=2483200 RepID=A0AAD7XH98_9STRA|nr:hypothetical protein CTAYLR_007552 [Chrysophaeum taylorii]
MFAMFAMVLLFLQGAGAVVPAVSELDPSLYVGRWYQISADALVADTFELKAECVTADYALASDPTYGTIIKLVNSETINGKLFNITGYAYIANESEPAELSVKFDEYVPSFATGSYWVILLGPVVNNQYQYSVVSDSTGLSLFVLARDVADYAENYASTVDAFLADNGYADFFAPIATVQDDCTYAPTLVQAFTPRASAFSSE